MSDELEVEPATVRTLRRDGSTEQLAQSQPSGRRLPRVPRVASAAVERFGVLIAWAMVVAIFAGIEPSTFLSVGNVTTIFGSQAVLVLVALAATVPLSVGELDLSVGGNAGLSMTVVGFLTVDHHVAIGVAIALGLGSGLIVGIVNSVLVLFVGLDSIIATLGTTTVLSGLALGLLAAPAAPIPSGLENFMNADILGIQAVFYVSLALVVILWYVFSFTPLGRHMYFVGAGREVARLTGIRVTWIRFGAFAAAGLIAGLAGVALAGVDGSADPSVGATLLLPPFAAAFLGSTVFTPGRFNPWGTWVAIYFLITGITGLELLGISSWIEPVFYGGSLIIAVALSRLTRRRHSTEITDALEDAHISINSQEGSPT